MTKEPRLMISYQVSLDVLAWKQKYTETLQKNENKRKMVDAKSRVFGRALGNIVFFEVPASEASRKPKRYAILGKVPAAHPCAAEGGGARRHNVLRGGGHRRHK